MTAAKREHRHSHSGSPPGILPDTQTLAVDHQHGAVRNSRLFRREHTLYGAVVALLPCHKRMSSIVDNHVFELQGEKDGIDIDREQPVRESDGFHSEITGRTPAAQSRMTAEDSYGLALLQLWCRNAEDNGLAV